MILAPLSGIWITRFPDASMERIASLASVGLVSASTPTTATPSIVGLRFAIVVRAS